MTDNAPKIRARHEEGTIGSTLCDSQRIDWLNVMRLNNWKMPFSHERFHLSPWGFGKSASATQAPLRTIWSHDGVINGHIILLDLGGLRGLVWIQIYTKASLSVPTAIVHSGWYESYLQTRLFKLVSYNWRNNIIISSVWFTHLLRLYRSILLQIRPKHQICYWNPRMIRTSICCITTNRLMQS